MAIPLPARSQQELSLPSMQDINFSYIESDAQLQALYAVCSTKPLLAIDSEFIRTNTFYPNPALIQLHDGENCYLIDPLTIDDLSPIKRLLDNPDITKILHSCSEDLEVFSKLFSSVPSGLFDTQIAANLIGLDYSISYQKLVSLVTGIVIDKEETRSDWLQRPLSTKQLHYAANDVIWLFDIYHFLHERLQTMQRLAWAEEDFRNAITSFHANNNIDQYYLRIKSASKLSGLSLYTLKRLCTWREKLARELNKPRNHIVKDGVLVDVARTLPRDMKAFSAMIKTPDRRLKYYGEAMVGLVNESITDDPSVYPRNLPDIQSLAMRKMVKKMKAKIASIAESIALTPENIASARDLNMYLHANDKQESILGRGWRKQILADSLIRIYSAQDQSHEP